MIELHHTQCQKIVGNSLYSTHQHIFVFLSLFIHAFFLVKYLRIVFARNLLLFGEMLKSFLPLHSKRLRTSKEIELAPSEIWLRNIVNGVIMFGNRNYLKEEYWQVQSVWCLETYRFFISNSTCVTLNLKLSKMNEV